MSSSSAIEVLTQALLALPGVAKVEAKHTPLEELDVAHLPLVALADLPHAALLRTNGGLKGEALGQFFFELRPELSSWRTLEFISWQVRDSSRAGRRIQIRSRGLPPVIDRRIQLGSTLQFIIEFFVDGLDKDPQKLLREIADFAETLESSRATYLLNWENGDPRFASE